MMENDELDLAIVHIPVKPMPDVMKGLSTWIETLDDEHLFDVSWAVHSVLGEKPSKVIPIRGEKVDEQACEAIRREFKDVVEGCLADVLQDGNLAWKTYLDLPCPCCRKVTNFVVVMHPPKGMEALWPEGSFSSIKLYNQARVLNLIEFPDWLDKTALEYLGDVSALDVEDDLTTNEKSGR